MNGWYKKQFSSEEVELLKKKREEKTRKFPSNNLDKTVDTRWIGDAGEIAVMEFLDSQGIYGVRNTKDLDIDEVDITFDPVNADVKTTATNYIPMPSYMCVIPENQIKKMLHPDNKVNCFIFCRYSLKSNIAYVLGWVGKKTFVREAELVPKGYKEGSCVYNTETYKLPISSLRHLFKLAKIYKKYNKGD